MSDENYEEQPACHHADTTERDERDVWDMLQYKLLTAADPDGMYMTPEEVAVYTGMSAPALAMLRYRGKGPKCLRPSQRVVRYRKRDVDAWMDAGSGE